MRHLVASLLAIGLAGCVTVAPTSEPAPTVLSIALPTTGPLDGCAGVQWDGPIVIEVQDGTTVARRPVGDPLRIFWPPGFTARFDGATWRVLDARANVFASSDEDITDYLDDNWHGWRVCATIRAIYVYE